MELPYILSVHTVVEVTISSTSYRFISRQAAKRWKDYGKAFVSEEEIEGLYDEMKISGLKSDNKGNDGGIIQNK